VDGTSPPAAGVRSGGWAYPPASSSAWLLGLDPGQRAEVWRARQPTAAARCERRRRQRAAFDRRHRRAAGRALGTIATNVTLMHEDAGNGHHTHRPKCPV